jgi:hypothetical protein
LNRQLDLVWFSHIGTEYEVTEADTGKIVTFKNTVRTFDWDNCNVQLMQSPIKKLRILIRGHAHKYSHYRKRIIRPTFLLSIDVDSVSELEEDNYKVGDERKDLKSIHSKEFPRYVFHLDDRYSIWEWKKHYNDIKKSNVFSIHEQIKMYLNVQKLPREPTDRNILVAECPHIDKEILPAMYQPAIDELKNFVREIHCHKVMDNANLLFVEVSIMFNNEELRRHKILNRIYEKFRLLFYGRRIDIETFRIYYGGLNYDDQFFTFHNIYSGDNEIMEDNIHLDRDWPSPHRAVSNYFVDNFHPVVFINTSNHALGENDNNNMLWKWEYQPFDEKSPVIFGTKSREQIDNKFTPFFARMLRLFIK